MVKPRILSIFLVMLILDQLTKLLIQLLVSQPIILIPKILSLDKIQNFGAGFGILQGQRMLLIWTSIIVIGLILFYYDQLKKHRWPTALVLAGAVGNLIDRVFLGYVVDFINFHFWPAFNVADSCISIGVVLLFFTQFRKRK
ncbi:MAG: signal peptidase II [Candidatus Woesearchaeota archaeon]